MYSLPIPLCAGSPVSNRLLLTVLSALLAPAGVLAGSAPLETDGGVEESAAWSGTVLPDAPGIRGGGAPPQDGAGSAGSGLRRRADRWAAAPATASPVRRRAASATDHLGRCGHDASHLDLPPPSLA